VTTYFALLYGTIIAETGYHDRPDRVIFFEGAKITLEAHMAEYPVECHPELRKVLTIGDAWKPDKVIVLTSGLDTIEKHIRQRSRPHEDVENMVRRFRLIDDEFRRLAPAYPDAIVVDRDGKEFHERAGLVEIIKLAGLPAFEEIAYEQIERFDDRRG
jgi:deoxyadenosine/deoxycytidine kinase